MSEDRTKPSTSQCRVQYACVYASMFPCVIFIITAMACSLISYEICPTRLILSYFVPENAILKILFYAFTCDVFNDPILCCLEKCFG